MAAFGDARHYRCDCAYSWRGRHCEEPAPPAVVLLASQDFIIVFIFCLIGLFIILVLVFVVYNRRREAQIKYPGPDDDIRENIINYEDEGGGEDDMTAFDITPLQIPIADPSLARHSLPRQKIPYVGPTGPMPGANSNVETFIEDHKRRADLDPCAPPFDDLRNYAYEGGGSTAGSLSSLGSDTDIGHIGPF